MLFIADLPVGVLDVRVVSEIFTHINPIHYSNTRDATEGHNEEAVEAGRAQDGQHQSQGGHVYGPEHFMSSS